MNKKVKKRPVTPEEVANLIDQIAEEIKNGNRSFDIQLPLSEAEKALAKLRHLEGIKLLNRIGLLLLNENRKGTGFFYPGVKETIDKLPPLDTVEDVKALQDLANQIRNDGK